MSAHPFCRTGAALALCAALGGCAAFSPDGGFGPVADAARQHLAPVLPEAQVPWVRSAEEQAAVDAHAARLLAQPLSMADAVQLALLRHPGLQAAYFEVAVAEAERVQAGLPPNPGISLARVRQGSARETERSLHLDLAAWIAQPWSRAIAAQGLAQARHEATARLVQHAAETRIAWVQAVAAQAQLRYRQQVMDAAEASAELMRRMAEVGNVNRLQRLREQAFHAEAALGLAQAHQADVAAREALTRLLGLWGGETAYRLPERLPDLPATLPDTAPLEAQALAARLDVQAALAATEQAAQALGLSRATRGLHLLELGLEHTSERGEPVKEGIELRLELPLFDTGQARQARAEARYRQALQRAAQVAVDARSQVREAAVQRQLQWEVARHHRDELVPLRQRISEENLLRYNGMLIGVFELLADARAQVEAVSAALDATRDFWRAQATLDAALSGPPPAAALAGPARPHASPDPGRAAAGH